MTSTGSTLWATGLYLPCFSEGSLLSYCATLIVVNAMRCIFRNARLLSFRTVQAGAEGNWSGNRQVDGVQVRRLRGASQHRLAQEGRRH